MKRPKLRPTRPSVSRLEARTLLNGDLTGTWIGQDQHDLVGPSTTLGPDGVQDIHISLSGLAAGKVVESVDIQGLGGGEWESPTSPGGPWAAALEQQPGSTSADLYLEPYQVETGRPFSVVVDYTDGSSDVTWVQGGVANPSLRMPSASLTIDSATQDGQDFTGLGPDVGPDGFQDLDLSLSGLSPGISIIGAELDGPTGSSWAFGHNPEGLNIADLIRNASDSTEADLYLQPDQDFFGQSLTLSIDYSNGETDKTSYVVSTHTNPNLPMPAPAALPMVVSGVSAQWIGQDGLDLTGQGDVDAHISGIPKGLTVVAATLSDEAGADWGYTTSAASSSYTEPFEPGLGYEVSSTDPTQADVSFSPDRNESGSTLTLRLQLSDGSIAIATFAGGSADPVLKVNGISTTSIEAHPGDDLNTLANTFGTVHLSAGEYDLTQPLVLNQPVTIRADPGVTLMFSQPAGATPWTAAILINASHTTLNGFAVRFAGSIDWNQSVQYGPAVIGSSDNVNSGFGDPKEAETLTNLDLEAPPAATSWELTPDLIRFVTAANGTIENNTLKGGTTEVAGGPWTIADNDYEGTISDTYTPAAFAAHDAHDLVLQGNTAEPEGSSGKTYRFLTMNVSGFGDLIADNDIVGIGPMDSDTEPDGNSPEIILTEAYSLQFEGDPAAIASDGRILEIPTPQGGAARTGDIVSILSGPDAGQYRMIAQAINATTYLMDQPLPGGNYAISISTGFVGETYRDNTVDARGSSSAVDLDLQGDQFGATIEGNTLLGGDAGFLLDASPTDSPNGFGWSHAPFLGATITGNTIGDAITGGSIAATGGLTVGESLGRVYFSGTLANNTFGFSDAFLAAHPTAAALSVGDSFSIDPGEIVLSEKGDHVYASADQNLGNPVSYLSATINGIAEVNDSTTFPRLLPTAPTNLELVTDSGSSSSDGITNVDDLSFDTVSGAAGYEYEVGSSTTWLPVSNPADFVPEGIVQGPNTISVRAYDSGGNRGPATLVTITYDTIAPITAPPALAPGDDSGSSASDGITNVSVPGFTVTGDATDLISLLRDGVVVATRTGPGTIPESKPLADGTYLYSLQRTDLAGNTSVSGSISVTIETTPPISSAPALAPGNDTGSSASDEITSVLEPSFTVSGDSTDMIQLLRNGVAIASRMGPGAIQDPVVMSDGSYAYSVMRTDVAGNSSISPATVVTLDRTPPPAPSEIAVSATYQVSFQPTSATDVYVYRLGTTGSYTPIGTSTSFLPSGLIQGLNTVEIHAIDLAGNVGPDATVTINTAPTIASGTWLGQDGHDDVGTSAKPAPDGIQDIHIALGGLRAGHSITSVDVRGLGGGEWSNPSTPGGPFAAMLIEAKDATTADLYIAPYQVETGRPFSITLQYDDGVEADFWLLGGAANPSLAMPVALNPLSPVVVPIAPLSPVVVPIAPLSPVVVPVAAMPTTTIANGGSNSTTSISAATPIATPTTVGISSALLSNGLDTMISRIPPTPAKHGVSLKRPLTGTANLAREIGLAWKRAAILAHARSHRR